MLAALILTQAHQVGELRVAQHLRAPVSEVLEETGEGEPGAIDGRVLNFFKKSIPNFCSKVERDIP